VANVLAGVVFALSGYENPERAELRDLAVSMGAQYRRRWAPDCNLLVYVASFAKL
jgi:DNA-repair protein XRCC1